jgi:uncharacterized protein DUF4157
MGGGGILGAIGGAVSGVLGALGSAVSGIGKLFTKAKDGGARVSNPTAIQAQLGSGTALDGGVRSRMETAFGHDFSRVRVHADGRAAELSTGLNARAFTIGRDVAFAAGEYRPGTLIGDALIAHELAHVTQQSRESPLAAPPAAAGSEYNKLEEDADLSAVGAMVSLWQGGKAALTSLGRKAGPRLRSGLRLQKCGGAQQPAAQKIKPEDTNVTWDAQSGCSTDVQDQINKTLGVAIPTVAKAIDALNSPKSVEGQLMKNFKMAADDPRVGQVRQVLQGVLEAMRATAASAPKTVSAGTTPSFYCMQCAADDYAKTDSACDAIQHDPLKIRLCLTGDKLNTDNLLRTMIHEYTHASCGRTLALVKSPGFLTAPPPGTGVHIASGNEEPPYERIQAEASKNLQSGNSYARFVIDVARSGG